MINDVSIFFIFFGGFMSWTIALGQILQEEKQIYNYIFAAIMFCLGSLQLLDGLLVAGKLVEYPSLVFCHLPFLALIGPLFFFCFKSANNDSFRFRRIDLLHFIGFIITIPLMIPLFKIDDTIKISLINNIQIFTNEVPQFRLYAGLLIAVQLNLAGYILYFVRECFFMLDITLIREKKVSPFVIAVILVSFPLEIVFFASIIAMSMFGYPPSILFGIIQFLTAISFFLTLVIFIMEKKNFTFFKLLHIQIENRRYEISKTKNLDVGSLLSRIQALMDVEKVFCDEDLSVSNLAEELSIEPYQLSQLINERFNKNFNHFINSYRIEEAKTILLAEADRTIVSVAYAVGFNSTTVFNFWFKRITGISPTVFRNNNKNGAPSLIPPPNNDDITP